MTLVPRCTARLQELLARYGEAIPERPEPWVEQARRRARTRGTTR
ncbi:hypothetical protein [Actinoplanes sp. NPDC049802]